MTAAAADTILLSRFPDAITPGALPILPAVVSLHPHRLQPGRWIVFRWFDIGGPHHEQSPPEFFDSLEEAWARVPGSYFAIPSPTDFAPLAFAPALVVV